MRDNCTSVRLDVHFVITQHVQIRTGVRNIPLGKYASRKPLSNEATAAVASTVAFHFGMSVRFLKAVSLHAFSKGNEQGKLACFAYEVPNVTSR
jgi:hypothetical protein